MVDKNTRFRNPKLQLTRLPIRDRSAPESSQQFEIPELIYPLDRAGLAGG